ncbi:MAG: ABC transporter permease subunit [Saprospiraceae bacterium]|nr:ABC transporter permease subunit [Saprospiraceae bacterium]
MFLLQLQYEWKHLSRNGAAWLLLLFLGGAMVFGAYNGRQRAARQKQAVQALKTAQDEKFAALEAEADSIVKGLKKMEQWWLDPTNPLTVGLLRKGGGTLVIEPAPGQALAVGMSDLQPEAYAMLFGGGAARGSSDYDNPARLALGAFDLAFVIVYLLPLFVIALTYNLLSAEREQGTLALLLSQPVQGRRIFVSKMLARFVVLSLMATLLFVPSAIWAGIGAGLTAQATGATLLYGFFWFLMALAVNMLQQNSAFNALACIGAWLLLVVVMPALVNMLAEKVHPVPSRAGYENAMRTADVEFEKIKPAILDTFYDANPALERKPDDAKSPRDWWLEELYLLDIRKAHVADIKAMYEDKSQSHADFARKLTVLSPALVLHDYLTGLAGTNRDAQLATQEVLESKAQTWLDWFAAKYAADAKLQAADYAAIRSMLKPVQPKQSEGNSNGLLWPVIYLTLMALPLILGRRRQMMAVI